MVTTRAQTPLRARTTRFWPGRRHGRAAWLWVLPAITVALAGIIGSVLGAHAVADGHLAQSRRALNSVAAQVASGVGLAVQREADMTAGTSAFVALNPDVSQDQFVRWIRAQGTHERYPELAPLELVKMVARTRLRAYMHDAPASMRPLTSTVVPSGKRPYYCLAAAGLAWGSLNVRPTGWIDACALPGARPVVLAARDGATADYVALPYLGQSVLEVETPVYRGGYPPASVGGRRRAFVGWLGETILPSVVLASALRGHPGTALTVSYHGPGYDAAFRYGRAPAHAGHVTVALQGGWSAHVTAPLGTASVFADAGARALLGGGIAISVLLGTLLYVLAGGRSRARWLVREKTRELEHLAMHDPLTGLPNRVLALDRAERMLARARRTTEPVAALYIDIDGFKHINDTFGHAAGDQFLRLVAARLGSVVRESDTAARLAGDEFLVLLDGQTLEVGPERVAERLLDVLRQPYDLGDQTAQRVRITASIGVAAGRDIDAERLVADADDALYAAKTNGKNRYAVAGAGMSESLKHSRVCR